jgi:restriction endonuclease Mrr
LSLPTELENLFGKKIMGQAKRLRPESVDAPAVQKAAGALLHLKGQPERQVDLVRSMTPSTAAALCRWLADPAFWAVVGGISRH